LATNLPTSSRRGAEEGMRAAIVDQLGPRAAVGLEPGAARDKLALPVGEPAARPPHRRHRRLRLVRHAVGGLVLLVCLTVLAGLLLLRALDTDMMKRRIHGLLRNEAGLEIDYHSASADVLSGVLLREVTVAQPPELRALAPDLLRANVIALGWSLFGSGPTLKNLTARDVQVTIIVDDEGHTSLDGLGERPGKREREEHEVAVTPGRRLAALLHQIPEFDRLQFSSLTIELVQASGGQVMTRTRLTGVDLRMAESGLGAGRHIDVTLGVPAHPLALTLARDDENERTGAAARLWLDARLDAGDARVRGELLLDRQTLSAAWPKKGPLLLVDALAHADGDALAVTLARFDAIAEAVKLEGKVVLAPGRVRVEAAKGALDLTRLAKLAPEGKLPVTLREGHLRYEVAGLSLDPSPKLDRTGHIDLDARALGFVLRRAEDRLELDGVKLDLRGRPLATGGMHVLVALPAESMHWQRGRERVDLTHALTDVDASLPDGAPGQAAVRTRFDALAAVTAAGKLAATTSRWRRTRTSATGCRARSISSCPSAASRSPARAASTCRPGRRASPSSSTTWSSIARRPSARSPTGTSRRRSRR
jgi:hypothetical protein